MKRLTVFCGSSVGIRPVYAEAARRFGASLAARDIELVYGGGQRGLMGVLANACLEAGGRVHGIIPDFMMTREWGHTGIQRLDRVADMSVRKRQMQISDAFVALPGGIGTLEELTEVLSWTLLDLQRQPIGLLSIEGFYDPLLGVVQHMIDAGFAAPAARSLLIVEEDVERMLDRLAQWRGVDES